MAAKNPYGLWLVQSKPASARAKVKNIALVESNEKGVHKWLEDNGHRLDLCKIILLPPVEFFDPVDDTHSVLGTGGIRTSIKTPKGKKAVLPTRTITIGYCPGSGKGVLNSVARKYGQKPPCPNCGKHLTVSGTYRKYIRKHK